MKKAIVLLNMGGAQSPEELKEFLYNMFSDPRIIASSLRHLIAPLIAKFRYKKSWKNYELIGGSRIDQLTESLAKQMQEFTDYDVRFAMRYSQPKLQNFINQYNEVVLIPLYPHYSFTTVESSLDEFKTLNFKGKIKLVNPFYQREDFNEIIFNKIVKSVPKPSEWHLLFSAHGLPQKMIDKGDPYAQQIMEHFFILKNKLSMFQSVDYAYQSRFGYAAWLQPYLHQKLAAYKGKNVLIYPIAFMIDNAETDYELKLEYENIAKEIGVQNYKVIDCPNDDIEIAKFLIKLSKESK